MLKVKAVGLKEAISHLERYQKSLKRKLHDFLDLLASNGVEVAKAHYADFPYDGSPEPIFVTLKWNGDSVEVVASGNTVLFIEFGAGVYQPAYPIDTELQPPNARGTYGKGQGKRERWSYYGEKGNGKGEIVEGKTNELGQPLIITRGNPPAKGMYEASKEIRRKIEELAKEAFAYDRR